MKKRLLPTLSLLFSVFLGFSQTDLSVTDIGVSCDQNNWVPQGIKTSVEVTLTNVDSFNLPAGDSALISVYFNGLPISSMVKFENGLDAGASVTHNFGESNRLNFTSSMDTVLLNAYVSYALDTVDSNDAYSETFYSSTIVNNDWHSAGIDIISPSNLNNFDIDNGTNHAPALSEIAVDLVNNGSVTYLVGTRIDYSVYIGASVKMIEGSIKTTAVLPNQTITRTISNQAVLPAVPDSAGTFQLCAKTNAPNDLTSTNDASCVIFKIVDNYDPTDPVNWPFGVDEKQLESAQVFMNQRELNIKLNASYQLQLFDLSGKMVRSEGLIGSKKFDLTDLNAGLYFVRINRDNAEPQTEKIILR
jgi:hypothetical protein